MPESFDYDLFVIGAGSGGVRASRISASMGARVACAEERFLGAMERYHQKTADAEISILEASEDGIASIRRYFDALIDRFTAEGGSKGCFMTNTTTELAPHDDAAKERTGAFLLQMQAAYYHAMVRAQTAGEIRETRLNDYARFLTNTAQGLGVLAKISPSRDILVSIVDVSIGALR